MIEKDEIWEDLGNVKGVEEFKGYQISNYGRVRDTKNGKNEILNLSYCIGYKQVFLENIEGVQKSKLVHRLVAMAFIPNPGELPEVNHIDFSRDNNLVDNLEWCTHSDNMLHFRKHNPGVCTGKTGDRKLTEKEVKKIYNLLKQDKLTKRKIASQFNVSGATISAIEYGYTWKYITDKLGGPLRQRIHNKYKNHKIKLTDNDVINIYNLLKEHKSTVKKIALQYDVSEGAVLAIIHGTTWKHVTDKLGGPITNLRYKK